jgi:hypothetical protein
MWEIIPNPGRIRIYTSGCPKNQNKCWYRIGLPPPAGSKNEVLKFRSVNSIVMAPARTGSLVIKSIEVMPRAHIIRGRRSNENLRVTRLQIIVLRKLILPIIEEIPAKCSLKIAKSTEVPLWNNEVDSGGYTVQPVPAPASNSLLLINSANAGGNIQKDKLFIRGKAISATPSIIGINQFPNPPIDIGITEKKIIIKA